VVTLDNPPPSAPEIDGLSHRFLRQCRAFPVALVDATLTIAMADPLDFETIAAVRAFSGLQIQTVLAAEQEILDAIEKHYGEGEQHALLGEGEDEQAMADLEHLRDMASEAPVIRLVNAMIADASKSARATFTSSRSRRNSAYGSGWMGCCSTRNRRRGS